MALLIRIDGQSFRDRDQARVSIFDHGFLFGDSVYEVVRTYGGKPWEVGPHLARLWKSAAGISLEIPRTREQLAAEIDAAVREAGCEGEAYVRIIVTRGVGEIDINPKTCVRPTIVIVVKDLPTYPPELFERGIDVAIVSTVRNAACTVDPSIKTGNYLNSVLALIDAQKRGAKEAVMLNSAGQLTECTTSNIFFAKDGKVFTPSLEAGILSGITRSDVIRIARESGVPIREGLFGPADLRGADEAFITSTTRGIMPIATVDGKPAGRGERPLTRRLRQLLAADVDRITKAQG